MAGRLVWDQEVGSSNLPAPTRYALAAGRLGRFKAGLSHLD